MNQFTEVTHMHNLIVLLVAFVLLSGGLLAWAWLRRRAAVA